MSDVAVSVDGLTKKFGDFTAVSGVTFEVMQGEIFGFLGANGAGKSTTIRMLCGILPPTSGTGIVAGYSIDKESRKVRQNIGYMSQKFSLYDEMTVYENLRFFAKLYSVPSKVFVERLNETAALVNLTEYMSVKAKSLSTGIKQRLSLACAIIHKPKILFLDEPTSGVDPVARRNFWDLIYSFSSGGVTIFVTTHYMDEAEYCDRIAMITAGKLKEIGTPIELKTVKMRLDTFCITGGALQKVAESLGGVEGIIDIGLLSDSVRILSKGVAASEISAALNSKGFNDSEVSKVEATLEDVFVSLSRRDT